jgi:hypothetical protein
MSKCFSSVFAPVQRYFATMDIPNMFIYYVQEIGNRWKWRRHPPTVPHTDGPSETSAERGDTFMIAERCTILYSLYRLECHQGKGKILYTVLASDLSANNKRWRFLFTCRKPKRDCLVRSICSMCGLDE